MAYIVLPLLIFHNRNHVHPYLEICTHRRGEGRDAQCQWCYCDCNITTFPLHGPSSSKARILGCPIHAVDTLYINLSECVSVGITGWAMDSLFL